jgi:hypothetical protein
VGEFFEEEERSEEVKSRKKKFTFLRLDALQNLPFSIQWKKELEKTRIFLREILQ